MFVGCSASGRWWSALGNFFTDLSESSYKMAQPQKPDSKSHLMTGCYGEKGKQEKIKGSKQGNIDPSIANQLRWSEPPLCL